MSRTVKSPWQVLPASQLLVLVVLASCLAVHFLVEDLVFLAGQPGEAWAAGTADELTHQDDLAAWVVLPARPPASQIQPVLTTLLPPRTQVFFPVLHPPKI